MSNDAPISGSLQLPIERIDISSECLSRDVDLIPGHYIGKAISVD